MSGNLKSHCESWCALPQGHTGPCKVRIGGVAREFGKLNNSNPNMLTEAMADFDRQMRAEGRSNG